MFLNLWLGIILSGGPAGFPNTPADGVAQTEVRPAIIPQFVPPPVPTGDAIRRGLRNPDYDSIPKVPPPGAKIVYSSVPIKEPYIAMTFDDGPHKTNTPRLLDMLKERNMKVTFFVVGQCAREYPDLIRRILAEGHEIGNHTWDHKSLPTLSAERERVELSSTDDAVVSASGYHMRLMRPPYGATNLRIKQECLDQFAYQTILWSVDPNDWKRPGSKVVEQRIVTAVHPGAIILSHDIHEPTIDAMPDTFDTLLTMGYHFVTVSQLLNIAAQQAPPPPVLAKTPAPPKATAVVDSPSTSATTTPVTATASNSTPPSDSTTPPTTTKKSRRKKNTGS